MCLRYKLAASGELINFQCTCSLSTSFLGDSLLLQRLSNRLKFLLFPLQSDLFRSDEMSYTEIGGFAVIRVRLHFRRVSAALMSTLRIVDLQKRPAIAALTVLQLQLIEFELQLFVA